MTENNMNTYGIIAIVVIVAIVGVIAISNSKEAVVYREIAEASNIGGEAMRAVAQTNPNVGLARYHIVNETNYTFHSVNGDMIILILISMG